MKDETDFDEEEYVRRYNEFAEEYSQTFKTHVDKLLKDAASSLSNRQFDTLTVDGPYKEVEVDVEVEGRGHGSHGRSAFESKSRRNCRKSSIRFLPDGT